MQEAEQTSVSPEEGLNEPGLEKDIRVDLDEGIDKIREAVRELEEPGKKLLESLRPEIENGTYTALLGDDVGARIPTLILRKVINSVYEEDGREPIQARFFTGGSDLRKEAHRKVAAGYIKDIEPDLGQRTLVIEEYSQHGYNLGLMSRVLAGTGLNFDVAVFISGEKEEKYKSIMPKGVKLFIGQDGRNEWTPHPAKIWDEKEASGVHGRWSQGFAEASRDAIMGRGFLEEQKRAAREEADLVAHRLIDWFGSSGRANEILTQLSAK